MAWGEPVSGTPIPPVAVAALRDAVRRAVAASSTRAVAAEIGISQPGIRKLLAGANPHAATVRKLLLWYLKPGTGGGADAETAGAALALLVDGFPLAEQERVRRALVDVLREAHGRLGTDPPPWLADG